MSRPSIPRVGADLVEWLKATYPARCIRQDETPEEARWYAAKAELASTLIHYGESED